MPITIRPAVADDAAAVLACVEAVCREPELFLLLEPNEFQMTLEEERKFLDGIFASDNSNFLIAEFDGQLVGTFGLTGGKRRATRHVATLGMSVAKEFRGQGVGRALLTHAVNWARASSVVKRIELQVFVENLPAIKLYESFGFQREGRRQNAAYRWGRYLDDLVMALLLG